MPAWGYAASPKTNIAGIEHVKNNNNNTIRQEEVEEMTEIESVAKRLQLGEYESKLLLEMIQLRPENIHQVKSFLHEYEHRISLLRHILQNRRVVLLSLLHMLSSNSTHQIFDCIVQLAVLTIKLMFLVCSLRKLENVPRSIWIKIDNDILEVMFNYSPIPEYKTIQDQLREETDMIRDKFLERQEWNSYSSSENSSSILPAVDDNTMHFLAIIFLGNLDSVYQASGKTYSHHSSWLNELISCFASVLDCEDDIMKTYCNYEQQDHYHDSSKVYDEFLLLNLPYNNPRGEALGNMNTNTNASTQKMCGHHHRLSIYDRAKKVFHHEMKEGRISTHIRKSSNNKRKSRKTKSSLDTLTSSLDQNSVLTLTSESLHNTSIVDVVANHEEASTALATNDNNYHIKELVRLITQTRQEQREWQRIYMEEQEKLRNQIEALVARQESQNKYMLEQFSHLSDSVMQMTASVATASSLWMSPLHTDIRPSQSFPADASCSPLNASPTPNKTISYDKTIGLTSSPNIFSIEGYKEHQQVNYEDLNQRPNDAAAAATIQKMARGNSTPALSCENKNHMVMKIQKMWRNYRCIKDIRSVARSAVRRIPRQMSITLRSLSNLPASITPEGTELKVRVLVYLDSQLHDSCIEDIDSYINHQQPSLVHSFPQTFIVKSTNNVQNPDHNHRDSKQEPNSTYSTSTRRSMVTSFRFMVSENSKSDIRARHDTTMMMTCNFDDLMLDLSGVHASAILLFEFQSLPTMSLVSYYALSLKEEKGFMFWGGGILKANKAMLSTRR